MFTTLDFIQIAVYFFVLTLLTPFIGSYFARVFNGQRTLLTPLMGNLERIVYRFTGVDTQTAMNWKQYLSHLLIFNFLGFLGLFLLQLVQLSLPLNPQHLSNISFDLAFNTAVSFMTNTNWQSYSGESTLSYFVQMIGLTVQNFVSAATGIAVMIALVRGLVLKKSTEIGNFWTDITRSILYILLPLSIILSIVLVCEGVVQNFSSYISVNTIEGGTQIIPQGPAASQIAIKQLGTNGGGFFGTNSAFPFENPTPLTNFLEMLSILLIPSALVYAYGVMTKSKRHGWILWGCMIIFLLFILTISLISEYYNNPLTQTTGSMEGKETRFGVSNSILWSVATTSASNGSINAMHDSFSPISGAVAMLNVMLGEIIFGGVGAGMYGIIIFVILTVFIAGLMVGRTPEYLGKKIEAFEIKMSALAVIAPSGVILVFSAIAAVTDAGLSSVSNHGPHGLSQILYAFSSAAGNNGSAFAGLNTNTQFYNYLLGIGMLAGRYAVIIPVLAIAGSLAKKNITPQSVGTFHTDTPLFGFLLMAVILIIGALTFFPALTLGPILEHLLMIQGISF
jgi:K+-transporting ATPase ATPase A chain